MAMTRSFFVLLFLSLLSLLLVACQDSAEEPSVPIPELSPFSEEVASRLDEIEANASRARGLPEAKNLEQGTLTRTQLSDYYELSAAEARLEEEQSIQAFNIAFRLLHMIGPEDDLLDLFTEISASGVIGFYSSDEEKLVLVSDSPGEISFEDELTLVHEYVHSFQHERFNFDDLDDFSEDEDSKENTEYSTTIDALVEGDASIAEAVYAEQEEGTVGYVRYLTAPSDDEEDDDGDEEEDEIPPAISRYSSFPYTHGASFVRVLYDEGGWNAVDDAFERPPETVEQILHPEKYRTGEQSLDLSLLDIADELGDGWEQEGDSVFGEYDVYNWLHANLDDDGRAAAAAAGWGAGRIGVYASTIDPDRGLVQLSLLWDDAQEAREFYTAFSGLVQLIDAEPEVLDPSFQIVSWDAPGEAGRAWIEGTAFHAIIAVEQTDLAAALQALDAPESIPESGYLPAGVDTSAGGAPIDQLRDILLRASDLPSGYVLVQSDTSGATSERQEYTLGFANARTGGSISARAVRIPGDPDEQGLWAARRALSALVLAYLFIGEPPPDTEVVSALHIQMPALGTGTVGVRVELGVPSSPVLRIQLVLISRGDVTIILTTFEDRVNAILDVVALAEIIDERLQRFQP